MVLSLLTAVLLCPALLGTQESIRQSQAKEKREEHRARRCNLIATCVKSSLRSREIDGRPVVLRKGKLYIDTGTSNGSPFGHAYAGYYLPYPDTKYEGLVTTITDVAPVMNWVYVDNESHEVKYGVRAEAQPNLTGPFNCTRQDRRLTFDGWEGWCAVEEYPSIWALYFDRNDDGLRSKLPMGTRVLEVELTRKEKRWQKESVARKEDQKIERAVNAEGQTPVEKTIETSSPLKVIGVEESTVTWEKSNPRNAEDGNKPSETSKDYSLTMEAVPDHHVGPVLEPYPGDLGTTGSPTDPHGGSDWSVQGDDIASTRSLSGYTPASSIHDDEAAEESAFSPGGQALKSPPPPIPPIPNAYRTTPQTDDRNAEVQSISQNNSCSGTYKKPYVEDDSGAID